jgi:hypothetical protein
MLSPLCLLSTAACCLLLLLLLAAAVVAAQRSPQPMNMTRAQHKQKNALSPDVKYLAIYMHI